MVNESRDFSTELSDLKITIEGFKDKGIAKQCPEYNLLINQLKEKLRMLTEKQAMINKKQKDLEFIIEDFPLLETCKKNIAPYENFWKAYAELDKCN